MRQDGLQVSGTTKAQATMNVARVATNSTNSSTIQMVDDNAKTPEQIKAKNNLVATINSGNAVYSESNILGDIGALFADKRVGNYIVIDGLPVGTTLGEVKAKYNLPDGSLKHMRISGGGNFDLHKAPDNGTEAYVHIYDDDLAEALGISTRELKGMFPEKQFSPWYKLGTNE